jgi:hydrogenase maturation protease
VSTTGTLVIGVGNRDRGDDAAGLELARLLRQCPPPGVLVLEQAARADNLLEAWRGAERVVVVDAACGGEPGTVRRVEAHREPLPASILRDSTHAWGVAEAVETARALGELPPVTIVYAVVGRSFEPGTHGLSAEVRQAVASVAEAIRKETSGWARPPSTLGAIAR